MQISKMAAYDAFDANSYFSCIINAFKFTLNLTIIR